MTQYTITLTDLQKQVLTEYMSLNCMQVGITAELQQIIAEQINFYVQSLGIPLTYSEN